MLLLIKILLNWFCRIILIHCNDCNILEYYTTLLAVIGVLTKVSELKLKVKLKLIKLSASLVWAVIDFRMTSLEYCEVGGLAPRTPHKGQAPLTPDFLIWNTKTFFSYTSKTEAYCLHNARIRRDYGGETSDEKHWSLLIKSQWMRWISDVKWRGGMSKGIWAETTHGHGTIFEP